MRTLDDVIKGFSSGTIDGRDANRIADFTPEDRLVEIGVVLLDENIGKHEPIEWTEENVIKQLKEDVEFGFEKALNMRGISAGLMFNVVMMWNKVLENELKDWDDDNYAMYGLPLFKATALLYGFPNEIGDDVGDEECYNEEDDFGIFG